MITSFLNRDVFHIQLADLDFGLGLEKVLDCDSLIDHAGLIAQHLSSLHTNRNSDLSIQTDTFTLKLTPAFTILATVSMSLKIDTADIYVFKQLLLICRGIIRSECVYRKVKPDPIARVNTRPNNPMKILRLIMPTAPGDVKRIIIKEYLKSKFTFSDENITLSYGDLWITFRADLSYFRRIPSQCLYEGIRRQIESLKAFITSGAIPPTEKDGDRLIFWKVGRKSNQLTVMNGKLLINCPECYMIVPRSLYEAILNFLDHINDSMICEPRPPRINMFGIDDVIW